jgi:hypothetical protein
MILLPPLMLAIGGPGKNPANPQPIPKVIAPQIKVPSILVLVFQVNLSALIALDLFLITKC